MRARARGSDLIYVTTFVCDCNHALELNSRRRRRRRRSGCARKSRLAPGQLVPPAAQLKSRLKTKTNLNFCSLNSYADDANDDVGA